jgi:DNA-binding CsgD family transcriptional regulator
VLDLLSNQFPWVERTVVMAVAKHAQTSIAIVGITGRIPTDHTKEQGMGIIDALENLAKVEHLRREAAMYRWLLESPGEALVIANKTGQIVAGTPEGFDALHKLEYGDRRSPYKRQESVIPADVLSTVQCGSCHKLRGIEISGSAFGRDRSDLIDPLTVFKFAAVHTEVSLADPAKLLTPTQFDVYTHLLGGLRYKEIASRMGISVHTVHRHTSDLLSRLRCSDRLELIVLYKQSVNTAPTDREKIIAPPLSAAPVVADLLRGTKSKRAGGPGRSPPPTKGIPTAGSRACEGKFLPIVRRNASR